MIMTDTKGEKNLPRYFAQVFDVAARMPVGRLDFKLSDGRIFRANGKRPGPVAEIHIHNPDTFARLVRELSLIHI